MSDPYTVAGKKLAKAAEGPPASKPSAPARSMSTSMPDVVVGKKHIDPQSRADEEYMMGEQKRINQRLMKGAERLSGEYRSRRYNDRRYGRR